MKKITDYDQFKSILPYSSEMFGVYQPLIGWKSKRILQRIEKSAQVQNEFLLDQLIKHFNSDTSITDIDLRGCELGNPHFNLGEFLPSGKLLNQRSILLQELRKRLQKNTVKNVDEWREFIANNDLKKFLMNMCFAIIKKSSVKNVGGLQR